MYLKVAMIDNFHTCYITLPYLEKGALSLSGGQGSLKVIRGQKLKARKNTIVQGRDD